MQQEGHIQGQKKDPTLSRVVRSLEALVKFSAHHGRLPAPHDSSDALDFAGNMFAQPLTEAENEFARHVSFTCQGDISPVVCISLSLSVLLFFIPPPPPPPPLSLFALPPV